jgi:hypothetical protein
MLDPEIITNLLQQVCVGIDFVGHWYIDSVGDSSGPREGILSKAATESSTGGEAMSPRQ